METEFNELFDAPLKKIKKRVSKSPPVKPPAGQTSSNKGAAPAARVQPPSLSQGAACYEADREKLARELHDSIGQPLTALKFIVESIIKSPEKNALLINEMRSLISTMQVDVRNICLDLQPASDTLKSKPVIPSKRPGGRE